MNAIRSRKSPVNLAGLALWGALELCVPRSAFSQSKDCVDAASLWLPSDSAAEKDMVVTKWHKDLTFSIISHQSGTVAVKRVEAVMDSLSHQTGLKIVEIGQSNEQTLPDLLIVVDPSVPNDAPLLREIALKFLQNRVGVAGRFQIDADAWSAKLRNASPKCVGLDVELNHAKNLSFIAIQEDATPACLSVGLGQSFGMFGVRNYYMANGEKVTEAIFQEGMRGLYSPEIRIGMKRSEAIEHLKEACK